MKQPILIYVNSDPGSYTYIFVYVYESIAYDYVFMHT